jgi:hypothetical protein
MRDCPRRNSIKGKIKVFKNDNILIINDMIYF